MILPTSLYIVPGLHILIASSKERYECSTLNEYETYSVIVKKSKIITRKAED